MRYMNQILCFKRMIKPLALAMGFVRVRIHSGTAMFKA